MVGLRCQNAVNKDGPSAQPAAAAAAATVTATAAAAVFLYDADAAALTSMPAAAAGAVASKMHLERVEIPGQRQQQLQITPLHSSGGVLSCTCIIQASSQDRGPLSACKSP